MRGGWFAWPAACVLIASCAVSTEQSSVPAPAATTANETATLAILRPDGLGPVDFGTPEEQAIPVLTDLLGPPDREAPIPAGRECLSGVEWLGCVSASSVIETGRLLAWDALGLEAAFVDSRPDGADRVPASSNLGTWRASPATGGLAPSTAEDIRPGMTVAQVRSVGSGIEGHYDEGSLVGVGIAAPNGGYHADLDCDPSTGGQSPDDQVRAIQAALNADGADLVVDGIWGPRSETAWTAFLQRHGLEPAAPPSSPWLTPAIGDALAFPTDQMVITSLSPATAGG